MEYILIISTILLLLGFIDFYLWLNRPYETKFYSCPWKPKTPLGGLITSIFITSHPIFITFVLLWNIYEHIRYFLLPQVLGWDIYRTLSLPSTSAKQRIVLGNLQPPTLVRLPLVLVWFIRDLNVFINTHAEETAHQKIGWYLNFCFPQFRPYL